jgi:SulP family sulfate permease
MKMGFFHSILKATMFKRYSGDLWGGFAAMLVALPSAIAFGITIFAPLGAEFGAKGALAGMLGVTALGLIAATFGGTQRLISAPCAPAAAVLSALTIQMSQAGVGSGAIVMSLFLVALVASGSQILFGVLKIGQLIKYMPFPVVSGYLSGVGLIIIFSQIPKWLALPKGMNWFDGFQHPELWQTPSLLIGMATAVVMVMAPKISTKVPAVIQGLVAGVLMYWCLAFFAYPELQALANNHFVIGPLSADLGGMGQAITAPWVSLGQMTLPHWEQVLVPALTLAVLLSIDTLKTCVVLDALSGTRHNSNKELIGQGLGNLVSTLIGGSPGAGTMGATLVNKASGGETAMSGVFQGLWALLAVLLLTPLIAWIPVAALAALLVVIGVKMIDWHSIQLVKSRDTVLDFAVIAVVVLVANTMSLIAASGLGVTLAILMFVTEQIHTSTVRRKTYGNKIFSKRIRTQAERELLAAEGDKTIVFELQGSLFFGTTDQLYGSIESEIQKAKFVLMDFQRVQSLDVTAGHMIERIQKMMEERDAILILSRLPERLPSGRDLKTYVDHIGLLKESNTKVFAEMTDALEWIEDETIRLHKLEIQNTESLALTDFDLFKDLTASEAQELNETAKHLSFKKGELIYAHGTPGNSLLLIARGQIKLTLPVKGGQHVHLLTLGKGQFFGEMSFLDGHAHSADAYAIEDTELLNIDRESLAHAIGQDQRMMLIIFKKISLAIAERLRHSNAELHDLRES